MDVIKSLANLVHDFSRDVEIAKTLESPNSEDDLTIRTAIVGFSYNSPTDDWGKGHYLFVRKRLDGEYSLRNLEPYGVHRENIQLFYALCVGYVLGLFQADKATEQDVARAEMVIPAIIAQHCPTLLDKPLT